MSKAYIFMSCNRPVPLQIQQVFFPMLSVLKYILIITAVVQDQCVNNSPLHYCNTVLYLTFITASNPPGIDYFKNVDDVLKGGEKIINLLEQVQGAICEVRAEAVFKSKVHLKVRFIFLRFDLSKLVDLIPCIDFSRNLHWLY